MKVAVIAEHDNQHIKLSTLNAVTAAQQFNGTCHLFILGAQLDDVISQAQKIVGVTDVFAFESEQLNEALAEDIVECLLEPLAGFDIVIAASSSIGKNFMPRLAAKLDVNAYSDVIEIQSHDTFVRPTYAGNVLQTIKVFDPVKLLTIRATSFEAAELDEEKLSIGVERINVTLTDKLNHFLGCEKNKSDRPELTEAAAIVSGGRGLQSGEKFSVIETLADKLGAAIGASRAAVDAGFISNDHQIGQTGKVVAPELYIAVGISGAIQHIAGMKDSKIIVAINKDPDAPIFQVANYGLVGDLFELVPELISKL